MNAQVALAYAKELLTLSGGLDPYAFQAEARETLPRIIGDLEGERAAVGKVCYKGNHAIFDGESDYGVCSSHEYATIYLSIEEDRPNPRGERITAQDVAEDLRFLVVDRESLMIRESHLSLRADGE